MSNRWLVVTTLMCASALLARGAVGNGAILIYRTADAMTTAIGYDVEGDAPVELVRLGAYGPSVLRRVGPSGEPGKTIWRVEGEAYCPSSCGVDLEFAEKLNGYIVQVTVGVPNKGTPHVYFAPREGNTPQLLARSVIPPRREYPEEDQVEPGVVGFTAIRSVTVAEQTGQVLITGSRQGDGRAISTYVLEVGRTKPAQRLEGAILGRARDGFFVSQGTKGWKALGKEEREESAGELARSRLLPVTDSEVTKVVQSGDRRAELHGRDGELYVFPANGPAVGPAASSAQATSKLASFTGCGSEPNRPFVTGVWASKRGTFMVAVDQNLTVEKQGRLVYGGQAHCLYEIQ